MKLWYMGTHLRELSEKSYPMNANMTGFRCFSKIFASLCFGQKKPVKELVRIVHVYTLKSAFFSVIWTWKYFFEITLKLGVSYKGDIMN